jgi:hypothetical protein
MTDCVVDVCNWFKQWLTLDQLIGIAGWKNEKHSHILYDPETSKQYTRRGYSSHDGTLIFVRELAQKVLLPLFNCSSYYRPDGQPIGMMPEYTVGKIKRIGVFGVFGFTSGSGYGQREGIIIPVRIQWITKEEFDNKHGMGAARLCLVGTPVPQQGKKEGVASQ